MLTSSSGSNSFRNNFHGAGRCQPADGNYLTIVYQSSSLIRRYEPKTHRYSPFTLKGAED